MDKYHLGMEQSVVQIERLTPWVKQFSMACFILLFSYFSWLLLPVLFRCFGCRFLKGWVLSLQYVCTATSPDLGTSVQHMGTTLFHVNITQQPQGISAA